MSSQAPLGLGCLWLCSLMALYTCACGNHMDRWMKGCVNPQKCTCWMLLDVASELRKLGVWMLNLHNNCLMEEIYEAICVCFSLCVCVCVDPLLCLLCHFTRSMVVETPWLIGSESVAGATCFSTVCIYLYTKLAQGCFVYVLITIPM